MQSSQLPRNGLTWFLHLENVGIDTIFIALGCSLPPIMGKKGFLVMAALISILLEMPKGDAMSSTGFSIGTTWATRICKEKKLYQSNPGSPPYQGLTPGLKMPSDQHSRWWRPPFWISSKCHFYAVDSAGKRNQLEYFVKSTSNRQKSYSLTSKSKFLKSYFSKKYFFLTFWVKTKSNFSGEKTKYSKYTC